jgi:DNA-binding NtrC family response regulator
MVADLPDRLDQADRAAHVSTSSSHSLGLDQQLESVERQSIQRSLERAKGNKSRAAKLLGISRARLIRRLGQLGLNDSDSV